MNCERCNRKEATVHLTEIIKGVKSEVHLCETCAKDIGLNSKLSNFSLTVPDFLSFLNDEIKEIHESSDAMVCKSCGTSITAIKKQKQVGCAHCYHFFDKKIDALLRKDDAQAMYKGRTPKRFAPIDTEIEDKQVKFELVEDVNQLKSRLSEAVVKEEYEEAALLRDKIRDLEQACRSRLC